MSINKKLLLSVASVGVLVSAVANAEIGVQLNIGEPAPVFVAPAYVSPYPTYYDVKHRKHDWRYWKEHRRHEEPVREEHHEGREHR